MSKLFGTRPFGLLRHLSAVALCAAVGLGSTTVYGQIAIGTNRAVGGIKIDTSGVVSRTTSDLSQRLREMRMRTLTKPEGEIERSVGLRMLSLKALEATIAQAIARGEKELPDDVQFMAGLQRIQYVFLYPEQNDIVLAGPAEGWTVNEKGDIVGITTGKPVLHLEDFLIALRSAERAARGEGISCSIDPTAEGRARLNSYLSKPHRFSATVVRDMQTALGPQKITVTGVPTDSRFAQVLVAADYQMKRYAMDLENAPVSGMPSFLDLVKKGRVKVDNMMPRWWLACNYEPLVRSDDGLAWELRGQGVKAMTEDEVVNASGSVEGTGRANPLAQRWADSMTERYDELSEAETVFGDLRNIMDMSVVSALIVKEGMLDRVGLELTELRDANSGLQAASLSVARTVPTLCSFMKVGRETVVTASGGVQVDSWQVTDRSVVDSQVQGLHQKARRATSSKWWWN